ncbi:MAG TPA: hypothetical protein VFP10_03935 [Candidatus Eisenbacteria bacterium]|nr:hypothetical protein [Candidatus Eisenbacteria bacterium]
MKSREGRLDHPWSFLGSSLWLRPLSSEDVSRCRAFLRRRDLLRAGDLDAPLRPRSAARADADHGLTLVAVDLMGAPAGMFHVHEHDQDVAVSFALPGREPQVLREVLRLFMAEFPSRTRALRIRIAGASEDVDLRALGLMEARRENGAWVLPLSERSRTEAPAPHAR